MELTDWQKNGNRILRKNLRMESGIRNAYLSEMLNIYHVYAGMWISQARRIKS